MKSDKYKSLSKEVAKEWWTLHRFGLTPAKLVRRCVNRNEPKILCVCVPKSGTHMLERALCLYPSLYRKLVRTVEDRKLSCEEELNGVLQSMRPGQIIFSHLHFTERRWALVARLGIRVVFMIRDPRDVAISEHKFIRTYEKHYLHQLFVAQPDLENCLRLTITGETSVKYPSIADRLEKFVGWFDREVFVIRFEDLIGAQGGGDLSRQRTTLMALYQHIGIHLSEEELSFLAAKVFSELSPTFRSGKAKGWQTQMSQDMQALFRQVAADILVRYGYESDPNW